jgi:hypothetical protein
MPDPDDTEEALAKSDLLGRAFRRKISLQGLI